MPSILDSVGSAHERLPLGEVAAAHEVLEGARTPGHVILDIGGA